MLTRQELIDQSSGYFLVKDQVSRNIRDGRQTQHRKPIKRDLVCNVEIDENDKTFLPCIECADGQYHNLVEFAPWRVGQIIYLREAFCRVSSSSVAQMDGWSEIWYRESIKDSWPTDVPWPRFSPSIHMPKAYARTFVRIKRVWIERVQDISEEDAKAEGCDNSQSEAAIIVGWYEKPRRAFRRLWDSIYPGSWDRNEWVWACEFEVVPC